VRKSQFSEEQIIAILKESEAGQIRVSCTDDTASPAGACTAGKRSRRDGSERGAAVAATGGGKAYLIKAT
jgi:hypothetical protein